MPMQVNWTLRVNNPVGVSSLNGTVVLIDFELHQAGKNYESELVMTPRTPQGRQHLRKLYSLWHKVCYMICCTESYLQYPN